MWIVIRTKANSDWRRKLHFRFILYWFENFDFKVVWALKYGSFKNDRWMTCVSFNYRVVLQPYIIGLPDYFLKLICIFGGLLLEKIWWLIFPINTKRRVWKLLRFRWLIMLHWWILCLSLLSWLFKWLLLCLSF